MSPDAEALSRRLAAVSEGAGYADAVHQLLAVVRTQLGMQVAWVSEFVGTDQVLRFVDAEPGADAPEEGTCLPLGGSFCARVLDGRFPGFIPDARARPETALLDVTAALHIGCYVGVPLVAPNGAATGMLCAISDTAAPTLSERDLASLRLLAGVLRDLQSRAVSAADAEQQREQLRFVMTTVVGGRGRHPVLQPIVEIASGRAIAAEGLTRFTLPSPAAGVVGALRSPAQWFDDAQRIGLRAELELATAASVLDLIGTARVPAGISLSVNLSPETVVGGGIDELLRGRELRRVVVELTEHAPVTDYGRLADVLGPYRQRGLRLAVDDAGAGYASLTHLLDVAPDLVKVDMALTRGAEADVARRALLTALARFATVTGASVVAEGVETEPQLHAIAGCGIKLAQGHLFGEASTAPRWDGHSRF
jgi:EAL domain-containing protein (putative c-di-GMP-specific phosphodiesterase class I)